ncbi:hypothetical protein SNE40_013378 [Patella caerulea]|uniref:Uncharacterized protein n=1 Tax=Patella caerulea TaxID=87958 RepID=A0AAN8JG23_PATCE
MEDPNLQHGAQQIETTYINTQPNTVLPYHIRNCVYLTETLYQMKLQKSYCDLIFEIHNQRINAHRAVVAAWSPFIYTHLKSNLACAEIVRVNYDNFEIFSDMISFMYTGKIDLRDTNLIQLLHLATSFQIEALREVCEGTLRCNLHVGNIVSTFYVARKFKLSGLEEYALAYLQMHLPEAVKQLDFLNLPAIRFNTFLATGWVIHLKPEVKLFLIISWLGYDVKEREQYLVALLQHIDWSIVAGDFLQEISQTENFFTTNESSLFLLLQTLHSSGISLGSYVDIFPSLREKYSHLLNQVVQNSVLDVNPEDYFPVSITVTIDSEQPHDHTTSVSAAQKNIDMIESGDKAQHVDPEGEQSDQNFQNTIVPLKTYSTNQSFKKKMTTRGQKKKDSDRETVIQSNHPIKHMITRNKSSTKPKKTETLTEPVSCFSEDLDTVETSNHGNDDVDYDNSYDYQDHYDDACDPDYEEQRDVDKNKAKASRAITKPKIKKAPSSKNKNKLRSCTECDYTTTSEARFEDHQRKRHNSNTERSYTCHVCEFTCTWNKSFYTHMKKHYYGPPFQCEHEGCKYTADTIRNILIHRVKHTDERPFPCEECPMKFRTRSNLYAHRKCHIGKKPWECEICHQCFATKSTLNQHSVRHSDDRPYLCDKCGFGTKFQSHLISHKRIHTGDVFKCQFPQCNYFSPKRSQLKGHMRTHLGIRKYNCEHCSKSFVEKSHLMRHEKIHLEVRPFSCSVCSYSTHRKDKLKEHVQKRHSCSETQTTEKPKRRKKKGKKNVKLETRSVPSRTMEVYESVEPDVEQQETDGNIYPQIVHNAQYINSVEPVVMETTAQNMIIHQNNPTGLVHEGQGHMLTSSIGHQQLHPLATPIDPQQLTVVMDARVHAHLNSRGLIIDPLAQPGSIQTLGQPNPADGGIVYTVPSTTTQTVVMATHQQPEYSNLGSYYSFVMNNEGQ